MARQKPKDEVLGEIKGRVPLYKDGLDVSGEIILCEEGLIVHCDGNTIKAPFRYVTMFEKSGELPLGKVSAEMDVYDQSGNKYYFHFALSDTHYNTIRRALGKD
ncbi:MAG: hypothetical protein N3E51_03120 [Candidatus Micrarchaeota archaeon]|nr:hypothetical protein [Candidatus Micrarchaeota archaeon]